MMENNTVRELFSVHSLGLTDVRVCACAKAGKTEADQILPDMDFKRQVQIEGCFLGFFLHRSQ